MTETHRISPLPPNGAPASTHDDQSTGLGLERLVFFSDAVFAIVITLLVLPLTAEIELPEEGQSLAALVREQWPRVLSFVVGFLVIGQFWIAHHGMFGLIRRIDHGLLWLNLIALLTVSFMPFPTAVLGARLDADDQFPVVFYAASMTVSSVVLTLTWLYARNRRLVDAARPTGELRMFTTRAVVTSVVFLVSIGAAFAGLLPAVLCWVLLLPAARLAARRLTG